MTGFKQLGKDSLIYGLGGVLAKSISFFLLPVYTRIFEPVDYGTIEAHDHRRPVLGHSGDGKGLGPVLLFLRTKGTRQAGTDPRGFGRTVCEALSLGRPVIGHGQEGVAEQLRTLFPEGLVTPHDWRSAAELATKLLFDSPSVES